MRGSRLLGAQLLLLLAGWAPPARAITIDFDDGTLHTAVGSFYSGLGVTFTNAGWESNFGGLAGSSNPFTIGCLVCRRPFRENDSTQPIIFNFSQPVSSVSIVGIDVGSQGARADAYDANTAGNLVDFDEAFGIDAGVGQYFTLTVAGASIRRVELYQPLIDETQEGLLWDNLSFTFAVPEPTVVPLLGLGFAGLVTRRHGYRPRPPLFARRHLAALGRAIRE